MATFISFCFRLFLAASCSCHCDFLAMTTVPSKSAKTTNASFPHIALVRYFVNVSDKRKETNTILTEYNMLMKQNDLGEEEGRPLIYAYKENI